ncbi:LPS export ABC transporter permease LptF [Sinimarinibacterium sp. CAU 1509]|uniref:LPS export ABC transporter permease LptF n=1 Tax=Sinimarinibacterium sp. CAU 1509 TaxID=2562283 RepID=UPI0010ACCD71|nr:LPS export ABC transporter permease LptF [Sinimarinibacterium sp. CAU 1509]TJY61113.1 LPS export ABC transporter permease LptF [Sinimarinibacterium sp. CAU 1509]
MNQRLLDRYLFREAGGAWLAVTLVLLSIMLSTRFARYLAQAASGELPRELLFQVAALSSLQYLVILIPVSLLLAIMLALGRLYRDSEVAAMTGCGVGLAEMYRPFLVLGAVLAVATAALAFEVGPWAGRTADYLVKNAARFIQFNPFEEGRFKSIDGDRAVFYTEKMDAAGSALSTVLAQVSEQDGVSFVTAARGEQTVDAVTGERTVTLRDGYRYRGEPGTAAYDVMHFNSFTTRVAPPEFIYVSSKRRLMSTGRLLGSSDPEDQAELAWRIAAPISVFILALLAVPLAHVAPRQGRYSKIVIGILAYLAYSELLGVGQVWIAKGKVPAALGLWWIHALMLCWALVLIARRNNYFRRLRA